MKKIIAFIFTLTLALSMATFVAIAGNGNNAPNHSSGGLGVQRIGNVEIRGNGNSARIWVDGVNTGVRPANNTWTTIELTDATVEVFVRGNAILDVRVTAIELPDVPYVVDEYSFYVFYAYNQVGSKLTGTTEVEDSRDLVGLSVVSTFEEVNFNDIPESAATGKGVIAGFIATGTLNYEFVRNYVEQFERVYVWVDVVVWSDGTRDEEVREYSKHVRGGLVDGVAYSSDPYAGSRAIDVSGGEVHLTRGGGQGYDRKTATYGAFSVVLYLANQSPRVDVISYTYDIEAL